MELTLVVSGLLWNRNLVMLDLETESLWSHILGEAKAGELQGEHLDRLSSVMTDWSTWKSTHPDTTVALLPRTANQYRREFYGDPAQFVLGISRGAAAKAWSYDQLAQVPVVNDSVQEVPIVIFYEPSSATVVAYERTLDDHELTFQHNDDGYQDAQTGSRWNRMTGKAISGPLSERQLKPAVGVVSLRRTWEVFCPESDYWQPPSLGSGIDF